MVVASTSNKMKKTYSGLILDWPPKRVMNKTRETSFSRGQCYERFSLCANMIYFEVVETSTNSSYPTDQQKLALTLACLFRPVITVRRRIALFWIRITMFLVCMYCTRYRYNCQGIKMGKNARPEQHPSTRRDSNGLISLTSITNRSSIGVLPRTGQYFPQPPAS